MSGDNNRVRVGAGIKAPVGQCDVCLADDVGAGPNGSLEEAIAFRRYDIPTFQMPSVFMADGGRDYSEAAWVDKVIPLEGFHKVLFGLKDTDMHSKEFKRVMSNILFYASWFPEETQKEFTLAQALYTDSKIKPPVGFMTLEEFAAPNAARFMKWIRETVEGLEKVFSTEFNLWEMVQTLELTKVWMKHLPEPDKGVVRGLFKAVCDNIDSKEFDWGVKILLQTEIKWRAQALAGIQNEDANAAAVERALSEPPSKKVLFKLADMLFQSASDKKSADPEVAEKIYDYLNKNAEALHSSQYYWRAWRDFLLLSPKHIDGFIDRHQYWRGLLADNDKDNDDSYENEVSSANLYSVYEWLIALNVVPENELKRIVLIILKDESERYPLNYEDYARTDSVQELKEHLVKEFLRKEVEWSMGINRVQRSPKEGLIGEHFFASLARDWGAEKTVAFIKGSLPEEVVSRLDTTFKIIKVTLDKSAEAAKWMLAEMQKMGAYGQIKIPNDPLWEKICNILKGPEEHRDINTFMSMGSYGTRLLNVPNYLIKAGFEAMVKDFYYGHHPFGAIYNLPEDIRPAGKGQTYVAIDDFPDLNVTAHPDERGAKTALPSKSEWKEPTAKGYHGFLTSTIAVGDTMGLAPKAGLYAIPLGETSTAKFPLKLLKSLREVKQLKAKDPSIGAVGLSIGFVVPMEFRKTAEGSALYKGLAQVCKELHEMGVAIIVSSGNDASDDNVNLFGFLPHVKLVGAYYTHYTSDRTDDTISNYSTKGEEVDIYAPADPALAYYGTDGIQWLVEGGTSSAQPFVSAAILLMRDVNPSLTLDQCWQILMDTADPLANSQSAKAIDPMEALVVAAKRPGSRYKGEKLKKLEKALSTGQ